MIEKYYIYIHIYTQTCKLCMNSFFPTQIQLRDVDKEVGILNFLEYLMCKIENDMLDGGDEANEGQGAPVHPLPPQRPFIARSPSRSRHRPESRAAFF